MSVTFHSDTGGPAFPRQHTIADANDPFFKRGADGMTLLDYFAGQALTGFSLRATGSYEEGPCNAAMVERSYVLAERMIAEKRRREGGAA